MPSTLDLCQHEPTGDAGAADIPVVDARQLQAGNSREVADAIRNATLSTGFLYLDHVFDRAAYANLLQQVAVFFALADNDDRKQAVCVTNRPVKYGWMPMYGEPAYQPGTVAHVESFDCGRPRRPGDDPSRISVWPELAGFRDATRTAWSQLTTAGLAFLDAVALTLGLTPGYLSSRCDSQDLSTLRLLNYPGGRSAATRADVGIAAHTDFECITLLLQTAPGLELRDTAGRWCDAPAASDKVVVLFGDMLERFTNGTVQATGHRVRRTAWQRYSVVLFFAVNDDVIVTPAPGFCGAGETPRYDAVTQRQHSAGEIERAERNRDQVLRA